MRRVRSDHDGAERADITSIAVVGIVALLGLRMQPRIGRRDDTLRGHFDGPGVGRAVVVGQEAFDGGFAGDLADVAAADAVGDHDGDALQAQQRLLRNQYAVKILIDLLAALVGVLTDRYRELACHARDQKKSLNPDGLRLYDSSIRVRRRSAAAARALGRSARSGWRRGSGQ